MRRGRILILVGLLLIAVLVAVALLLPRFLPSTDQTSQNGAEPNTTSAPAVETVQVVRLIQPVKRGDVITENVLGLVTYPEELVVEGMFVASGESNILAEVVERKAKFDLDQGTILTSQLLLDLNQALPLGGSDAALSVPAGNVAVSIPITRLAAVSYAPQPGDHVDVIATLMLVDLDTDFQTILPNLAGGVLSPGPGVVIGTGPNGEEAVTLTTADQVTRLTGQIVPGGPTSVLGRTIIDPTLGVPLYVSPNEQGDGQRPRVVSTMLMQNVIVLRVGNFAVPDENGNLTTGATVVAGTTAEPGQVVEPVQTNQEQAAEPTLQTVTRPADVITLIVSPQDAVTLNYLIYNGAELTLALRGAGDEAAHTISPVTLQFLLETYTIPVPSKLPYGFEPRVDDLDAPELPNDQPVATPVP